ncbi:Brp/Blh family beta-carotene 15,15'-dioxygenase [Maribacter antarcticus]|uniref:Brp/Blh family beta-carotene 15,15'-dioxygenase n=1 Tax=Maribacter antarcticus TaxID=505250 RepID=UPI000A043BCD|nr:Brp/Blh family beta-carotene 15,15'-dioxygenase [Maribacter antarcticus]
MKKNIVQNIDLGSFTIVTTFFSLWLAIYFEEAIENMLAYLLILTFGILHGANDIKLLQKANKKINTKKGFFITLIYYTLFVLGSGLLFLFIPTVALAAFVLFSGYHFGEQHWVSKIKVPSVLNSIFLSTYGIFILFLIFSAHAIEVSLVIEQICGFNIPINFYSYGVLSTGIITCLFGAISYAKKKIKFNVVKQLFFILVLTIVFYSSSLLLAFAIYFILWHSLPSMVDQIKYLYGAVTISNIKKYVVSSFTYWLISVLGMGIMLILFKDNLSTSLAFFFSFLAAITFPHVLVINRLYKR